MCSLRRPGFYGSLTLTLLAVVPCIGHAAAEPAAVEARAEENPPFDILEYRIDGNTLLSQRAIERAVYPHLGEAKTLQDVEKARQALERSYQQAGFLTVFVDIPPQTVENGTVTLHVAEGKIAHTRVKGGRYYSHGRILAQVPALAEGTTPQFDQVQKELAALSGPNRRITPVLRPGRTPGTVDVELQLADQLPLHGQVELNNRYSANTTPTRLNASVRYDNLWQREHSVNLGVQVAPEETEESRVVYGTYVWPLADRSALALYGVRSSSNVAAVGDLNVIGKGTVLGARYIRPLRGIGSLDHSVTLGVDYKDFGENVRQTSAPVGLDTPVTYAPFMANWDGTLRKPRSVTEVGLGAGFSIRGVTAEDADFSIKRFNATASYFAIRGRVRETVLLPKDAQFVARVDYQYSGVPLIVNEQFAAGGVESVRGYLEFAAVGDSGYTASVEVRSPSVAKIFASWLADARLHAFVDGGQTAIVDALPGQDSHFSLLSTGVGMRVSGTQGLAGAVDVAYPFETAGLSEKGKTRVHFKVSYQF